MFKRITAVLLFISLFLMILPAASAETIQPRYSHIHSMSADCELYNGAIVGYGCGITLVADTQTTMTLTILKQSLNGGMWSIAGSWSDTVTGVAPAVREEYVYPEAGYQYISKVTVTIRDPEGNLLEEESMLSQIAVVPANYYD